MRKFATKRRRIGDANRRSGKPRQNTRPQDGMEVDHQIEAVSAQAPDEPARIARETPQRAGTQLRVQPVAWKHPDLIDERLPRKHARGRRLDQPGDSSRWERRAQRRNSGQAANDISQRAQADHEDAVGDRGIALQTAGKRDGEPRMRMERW